MAEGRLDRHVPGGLAAGILVACLSVLTEGALDADSPVIGPDLVLWLDAQDVDGDGDASNEPEDGAALRVWADKSLYESHAVQVDESRQPSYEALALEGGLAAVHFEARSRQCLSAGKRSSLDVAALTAFVVARAERTGNDTWLFSKSDWGPPWTGYGVAVSDAGLRPWPHLGLEGSRRGYLQLEGDLSGPFRLVEVAFDGSQIVSALDGKPDRGQEVSGAIIPNDRDLLVGTLGAQFLEGHIAEVLLYRTSLGEEGRRRTRRYLLEKYGLPAPDETESGPLVKDWIFQAEGKPLLRRAQEEILWTRELAARVTRDPRAPSVASELSEIEELSRQIDAARTGSRSKAVSASARDLYLSVRRVKRRIVLGDPRVDFRQILCIDQPYPQGSEWPHQAIHRLGIHATPGGRLIVLESLEPGGPVREIGPSRPGSYWRPDLSFDGQRVVFCFKADDGKSFHLYETGIDGQGLRQLTEGDYDDLDPIYMPDGHLLFTTTRGNTYVRCGPYIYSTILARCNADGRDIYLISQNSEPDFVPSLMEDGRVVYSRWEYTDKSVFRIQSLWTTRPDGTGTTVLWGNQSVWPDHLAEPRQIPGSRRVMFSGCGHHDWFSGSIGIIDPERGFNFPEGLTQVTWDLPWPEVSTPPVAPRESEDYHSSGRTTSYKTPYPLSEELFLVSARGSDDRFRLYLMDVRGNRELIAEGAHHIWHAIPVRPRPVPPRIPDRVTWPGTGKERRSPELGVLLSPDVYEGVPDLPRGSVKYLRVMQSDAKTYSSWFKTFRLSGPPVSIVYEESVKRVLGIVPVEPDGSVSFEVPPGQALHFQLLDASGRCVQTMRSFTGVMPGEVRGCVGCHESHTVAPPHGSALAFRRPPTPLSPPWGAESIGYERFVQPVLDRYCGECHQGDGKARKTLDLTLRPGANVFQEPYLTLVGAAGWQNPVADRGQAGYGIAGAIPVETTDATKNDPAPLATLRPGTTLSSTSRLIEIASSGEHHDVRVDPVGLARLMTWVDANCPYLGEEELRELPDPEFAGIEELPIRPRIRGAPVIERP